MKKTFCWAILFWSINAAAQIKIHTEDIVNFWAAFDSVHSTNDKVRQLEFVEKMYLNKAGAGIQRAIELGGTGKNDWLDMMIGQKAKLGSIRPFVMDVENQVPILTKKLARFGQLYPRFKPGDIYFIMGTGIFGGNTYGKNVVIGCEVMANEKPDWAVSMVLHEFVHTQQVVADDALLQHCIMEGMADFVAELVNQKSLTETYPGGYIDFGQKHDKAVWEKFKKYIGSNDRGGKFYDWIYGSTGVEVEGKMVKDLGYYLGYRFCKGNYDREPDKIKALREIIEYDLSTNEKARAFVLASGYVPKKDRKFVEQFQFAPVVLKKKRVKKSLYGYKIKGNTVIFTFKLPKKMDLAAITQVSVAGSFNGWNPRDEKYFLKPTGPRTFELQLPAASFQPGKTETFKFVLNGDDWQSAPETASNVENGGHGNLTLLLK